MRGEGTGGRGGTWRWEEGRGEVVDRLCRKSESVPIF